MLNWTRTSVALWLGQSSPKWFKDCVSLILAAFPQNSPWRPLLQKKFIQDTRTLMYIISRTSALLSNLRVRYGQSKMAVSRTV